MCADGEAPCGAATAGSLKKVGWGKAATCARVDDCDFCFGTPGRVWRSGVGFFFFSAAALGAERLAGGLFFSLDGSSFRTRWMSEGG
jgi:hypothetical protein